MEWGPGDPLPCQHSSALYGVQGGLRRGVGGPGWCWVTKEHQGRGSPRVCKYFNTVPTAEAEVDSSGLVHEHSSIEVLHTELQPLSLEPGTDLWACDSVCASRYLHRCKFYMYSLGT